MEVWPLALGLLFVVLVVVTTILFTDRLFVNITGKYVLITGCDSGFGNLLARRLGEKRGCHVIAACLTEAGRTALDSVTSSNVTTIFMDIRNSDSIQRARDRVKSIIPRGEGLWGLVNNAGIISALGLPHWHTRQEVTNVMEVNLLGTIDVTNTFFPLVREARGRVVNVSSGVALFPTAGSYYAVSKAGVEAYSDFIRASMQLSGVSVHIIEPGSFKSSFVNPQTTKDLLKKLWYRLPLEERQDFGGEKAYKALELTMSQALEMASSDLHLVTDAMEHALSARFPWRRYLPGLEAKLFYKVFSLLPAFFTDFVFALGLNFLLKRNMKTSNSVT
ncbi:retinol dehydrogenase 3-like [Acanthaster planci]|uniref:Retinol dehydrogenase 3-like n=1 Tax=Acanthaster planci TaxID=133434 RepID=A0A8B7Z1Q7_ACAPL|nr:retinol dehydrogenase 3-like [Acanthaster planci]